MKKLILSIFVISLAGNIRAQESHSEISVFGAGGLAGLNYKTDAGSHNVCFGGLAGIGYTWFFHAKWGVVTGVELASYNSECTFNDGFGGSYQAESGTSAQQGNDFTFAYAYNGYREKQTAMFIQVPIMAQFQSGIFYAAGGVKLGFPVKTEYTTEAASLATSGHFPFENQTYNTLPDRGMGTYSPFAASGHLGLDTNVMLSLETGAKWTLSDKINLYAGIYFDYGLIDIDQATDAPVVEYSRQAPGKLAFHSATDMPSKVNTIGVGLKIKVSYNL